MSIHSSNDKTYNSFDLTRNRSLQMELSLIIFIVKGLFLVLMLPWILCHLCVMISKSSNFIISYNANNKISSTLKNASKMNFEHIRRC